MSQLVWGVLAALCFAVLVIWRLVADYRRRRAMSPEQRAEEDARVREESFW